MDKERTKVYWTIAILILGLLAVGITGYVVIEGWSFLDSLYMVVITLTTVGFREVNPLSPAGRIFTILLLTFGLAILLYVLRLFSEYVIEDKISEVLRAGKTIKMIKNLENPIIVVGFGRVGKHAARELKAAGASVVVIEKGHEAYEKAREEGFLAILGDGGDENVLKQAGIMRAKALLTTAGEDSENVLITITAKSLNNDIFLIARSNSESISQKLLRVGANRVVTPAQTGGFRMASFALRPIIADFLDEVAAPTKKESAVADVIVKQGSQLSHGTIADIQQTGAVVLALQRKGANVLINPKKDLPVETDDRLVILGDSKAIEAVRNLIG
jgi:voltage-gated potassium channel